MVSMNCSSCGGANISLKAQVKQAHNMSQPLSHNMSQPLTHNMSQPLSLNCSSCGSLGNKLNKMA